MQTFWVSSNDHMPYKYLCWTCLALQNIHGNLCRRYGEPSLKSKSQLNSPALQMSKELVGNVGTTVGHEKEGFCSSDYSLNTPVSCSMFRRSIIWICPARQGKLSETVFILQLQWALKMDSPVLSPCEFFCSWELKGIMLIYTSDWYTSAHGIWLQTSLEFLLRYL